MGNEITKTISKRAVSLNSLLALIFLVTFLTIPAFASEPIVLAQASQIENSYLQVENTYFPGAIVDDGALSLMVGMGADNSNIDVHKAPNVILWDEDGRGKRNSVSQSDNTGVGNVQEITVTMTSR